MPDNGPNNGLGNSSGQARSIMRLGRLDIARGIALLAMAIYHTGWDLEFFGYIIQGTTAHGGWKLFARSIASSFLLMVGFSLVLAHGKTIRWQSFRKRLLQLVSAAAAISALTWYMMPEAFIFFGILHQIALASLLGLLFLKLPFPVTLVAAVLVLAAPFFARSAYFDHPALSFIGLSTINPPSNDYVPLFPWFGAVLAGIALARIFERYQLMKLLAGGIYPPILQKLLTTIGRHGLAFYLLHQPILMALIFTVTLVAPPSPSNIAYVKACEQSCQQSADLELCKRFCGCVVAEIERQNLGATVYTGRTTPQIDASIEESARFCSAKIAPDQR